MKIYKLHQCSIATEGKGDMFDGHFKLNLKEKASTGEFTVKELQCCRSQFSAESIEEILRDSILSTASVLLIAKNGEYSKEQMNELVKAAVALS